jgi:rubrerythrin
MDLLDDKKADSRTKAAAREEHTYDCDVCGRAVTGAEQPSALRDITWMCRSCGLSVSSLPGSLHRAASRFLMGNVL